MHFSLSEISSALRKHIRTTMENSYVEEISACDASEIIESSMLVDYVGNNSE